MREILPEIRKLVATGEPIALATVVKTTGSVPRTVGSSMALTPSGYIVGSVSGGCLESDVYDVGMEVLESGRPRVVHYGISDDMAFTVGLSCGGEVDILVEPLEP
jgi:xanthine dehydrogenase accessory factor